MCRKQKKIIIDTKNRDIKRRGRGTHKLKHKDNTETKKRKNCKRVKKRYAPQQFYLKK